MDKKSLIKYFKIIEERDIKNFQDYLDWCKMSENKTLSEDFIRGF